MATFRKTNIKNCENNHFSKQMDFTCKTCGHTWIASSGASCPECKGAHLVIRSQDMTVETDDDENRRQFESWWRETMNTTVMDLHRFCHGYACHETNRGWMAWNACRAAMLNRK